MHPLLVTAFACCLTGLVLSLVGGILYNPPIQRYLEKMGVAPSFFLYSLSGLRDYVNAKKLAKRWGHDLGFLKRYERLQVLAMTFFTIGVMLMLGAELAGF